MEPKDWIAIYAAIISTFVFVWRVFEYNEQKKVRIKIKLQSIIKGSKLSSTSEYMMNKDIEVIVTNTGNSKRYINRPYAILEPLTLYNAGHHDLPEKDQQEIPAKSLHSGETCTYLISKEFIDFAKKYGSSEMQVIVRDTLGKIYKSEFYKL